MIPVRDTLDKPMRRTTTAIIMDHGYNNALQVKLINFKWNYAKFI